MTDADLLHLIACQTDPRWALQLARDACLASADDEPKKQPGRRRGGRLGGLARAAALSSDRGSEIARKAAQARWQAPQHLTDTSPKPDAETIAWAEKVAAELPREPQSTRPLKDFIAERRAASKITNTSPHGGREPGAVAVQPDGPSGDGLGDCDGVDAVLDLDQNEVQPLCAKKCT